VLLLLFPKTHSACMVCRFIIAAAAITAAAAAAAAAQAYLLAEAL
jgi:hypothetical protein